MASPTHIKSPKPGTTAILVVTDLDDDDFEIIADNIEFGDHILFVCDKDYSDADRRGSLNLIVDNLKSPLTLIAKLRAWAKRKSRRFSAVIGLDEEYRYRISEAIAESFSLRFYPRKTLDLCSNKYLQKVALSNAGIMVPDFQLMDADGSISKARIGFPNVLKLMTGVGSAHLHLNRSQAELKANLRRMKAGIAEDASNPILSKYQAGAGTIDPASDILLEEFIGGNEYSCDYLIEKIGGKPRARVLRVVRKLDEKGDFGYFAGFYLHNPDSEKKSEFRLKGKGGLEELCTDIARTLGIGFGVCMLDFKYHNGRFYVIETTLRPGIATFVELMARQYGYISLSQCLRQRRGLPLAKKIPPKSGLVAYLNAPEKGIITKIDLSYIADNMGKLGIIKLHKYCEIGESHINVAYVLASASSLRDALGKFEIIREKSIIEVSKQ